MAWGKPAAAIQYLPKKVWGVQTKAFGLVTGKIERPQQLEGQ
jgi:hypothetical protein